jgi:hypothetical protein
VTRFLVLGLALLFVAPVFAIDCGRLPTGKNPSLEELDKAIGELSAEHGVPTEIIKAIAWRESGCQQWRANGTLVYNKTDCGLGMMQLTGATAKAFDVDKLKDDWRYNLESGIKVLNNKWARAQRRGHVTADPRERRVLENWYYAVAFYWGGREESYLRKIFGSIKDRPGRLAQLIRRSVEVTIPSDVIKGFSFGDSFTAHEGNRFVDKNGNLVKAPTHLGTIGDAKTMAKLDVLLSRGKAGFEKGKPKRAIKYLVQLRTSDLDTYHKAEAEQMLASLSADAKTSVDQADALLKSKDSAGALKLLRKVARDYKGLKVADGAKAKVAAIKAALKAEK